MHGIFKVDPNAAWAQLRVTGTIGRFKPAHPNSDFEQPGNLFRTVMTDYDRNNLISNMSGHLKGAKREIQERQVKILQQVDPEYAEKVAQNLGFTGYKARL